MRWKGFSSDKARTIAGCPRGIGQYRPVPRGLFCHPIIGQMWQGIGRIFRALAEIEIDKSDISAVAIRSRKSRCHILEGITGGEHLWISRTFIM